jgi:hypothetical protein
VEYEAKFAREFDAGELDLPQGVTLGLSRADQFAVPGRSASACESNPVNTLTSRNAPLVSFQEVPRRLEHVYLKTMADAQGVSYAA